MSATSTTNVNLPLQVRAASVAANSVNAEARTVEVVWTTGARVARYSFADGRYLEELATDAKSVRLGRLNAGGPVLDSHRSYGLDSVIGVVEPGSAKLANGEGRATVRFARDDERADSIWRKVEQGIIRAVSVGYRVHKMVESKTEDGSKVLRATDWEPFEISFVAVGADAEAGVRADGREENPCELTRDFDMPNTATVARPGLAAERMAARFEPPAPEPPAPGSLAARMAEMYPAPPADAGREGETRGQHGGNSHGEFKPGLARERMAARLGMGG